MEVMATSSVLWSFEVFFFSNTDHFKESYFEAITQYWIICWWHVFNCRLKTKFYSMLSWDLSQGLSTLVYHLDLWQCVFVSSSWIMRSRTTKAGDLKPPVFVPCLFIPLSDSVFIYSDQEQVTHRAPLSGTLLLYSSWAPLLLLVPSSLFRPAGLSAVHLWTSGARSDR